MQLKRIGGVDLLRGAAIIIMIIANSCPYLLLEPYPYWFRFINSLAAPLFIFISGFSLMYTLQIKRDYAMKIRNSFYLLSSAVLLDCLVWRIQPFQTFDVLYLIATGMLINVLLSRTSPAISFLILLLVFTVSVLLQSLLSYRLEIQEIGIFDLTGKSSVASFWFDIKRYAFDGWFPLLPWIVFSIAGGLWSRVFDVMKKSRKTVLLIASSLFVVFAILLFFEKQNQPLRDGYLELFYPAGSLYVATALSFVVMVFSSVNHHFQSGNILLRMLRMLGQHSLFLYLLHAIVISFIFELFLKPGGFWFFVLMLGMFSIFIIVMAYGVQILKQKGSFGKMPLFLRSMLGLR